MTIKSSWVIDNETCVNNKEEVKGLIVKLGSSFFDCDIRFVYPFLFWLMHNLRGGDEIHGFVNRDSSLFCLKTHLGFLCNCFGWTSR